MWVQDHINLISLYSLKPNHFFLILLDNIEEHRIMKLGIYGQDVIIRIDH